MRGPRVRLRRRLHYGGGQVCANLRREPVPKRLRMPRLLHLQEQMRRLRVQLLRRVLNEGKLTLYSKFCANRP